MASRRSFAVVFAVTLLLVVVAVLVGSHDRVRTGPERGAENRSPRTPAMTGAETQPAVAVNAAVTPAMADEFRAELDHVRGFRDRALRGHEFGRLFRLWLTRDFEGALAYLRGLSVTNAEYASGTLLLLDFAAQQDVDRALQLARELARGPREQVFYSSLFDRLTRENPAGAVARVAAAPAGESHENALRAIASVWSTTDFSAALNWAQNLADPTEREPALETVLHTLSMHDPLRAIEIARDALTGSALQRTLAEAMRTLTATDPSSAAALVPLLPAGETQTTAALDLSRALAERDPAQALAWIGTLPNGDARALALTNALDAWSGHDPVAAGRYVAQMPAGPAQDAAAARLARTLGGSNPNDAAVWAQALTSETARSAAFVAIGSAWAQNDAPAAARWAAQLPATPARTEALAGALSYWALQDSPSAQAFVAALDVSTQPRGAAEIAPLLAQQDPEAALRWAQSLPAEAARDAATQAAFGRWFDNAPESARAWLATAKLSRALRTRLLDASGG